MNESKDIGGIIDHHCCNFLFITLFSLQYGFICYRYNKY